MRTMPPPMSLPAKRPHPSLRRRLAVALAVVAIGGGIALALQDGALPGTVRRALAIDLARPESWFIDWRLAALKADPELCREVLKAPIVESRGVDPKALKDGCGWSNAVRLQKAGGARLSLDPVSCEVAAALGMWLAHAVQPAARELLGSPIVAVHHHGAYSCRNIAGSPALRFVRSQHATANAADITGFTLADGRRVTVLAGWNGTEAERAFLRRIHAGACRYFRVAVGPDYNAAHKDHFHLDRGLFPACR